MRYDKPTKDEVLNFNEDDWVYRRSSGYCGYDRKNHPGDESKWIFEEQFYARRSVRDDYDRDYKLIADFRLDQLPLGEYPDYHIQEFLNNKYFPNDNKPS